MLKCTVENTIKPWLTDSNLGDDDYEVQGDAISKRFHVQVKGQKAYAARRVNQAIGGLKRPGRNAGWRRFVATPPTGGAGVEFDVSVDKNLRVVARELGCKKIVYKLLDIHPERRCYVDEEKGVVSSNWKDLVAFSPAPSGSAPAIHYSEKSMQELGLDVPRIRQGVQRLFEEQTGTEWCL